MNTELKFYEVNADYLDYLRGFDIRVSQKGDRTFICVEVSFGEKDYYLPLTSKVKTKSGKKRSSQVTTKVMNSKGEAIACILYNNMLPIPKSELTYIDFKGHKYQTYFEAEYQDLKYRIEEIKKKAYKVYCLRTGDKNPFMKEICCDFKLLETKCEEWTRED